MAAVIAPSSLEARALPAPASLLGRRAVEQRPQFPAPVGVAGDDALGGEDVVVAGVGARRVAPLGHRRHRVEQDVAQDHDGAVGGAEMLARAVDDRAHALLHRMILGGDAVDPGEGLGLLLVAVDHPVDVAVAALAVVGELLAGSAAADARAPSPVLGPERRLSEARRPGVEHGVLVVHRHPGVAARLRQVALLLALPMAELEGELHVEGHHELVHADPFAAVGQGPGGGVDMAVVGALDLVLDGMGPGPDAADAGIRLEVAHGAVQAGHVEGIDAALQRLQPVAFLPAPLDEAVALGHRRPGEIGRRRPLLGRSQIGPDEAAALHRGVGGEADAVPELPVRGSVGRSRRRPSTSYFQP